MVEQSKSLLKNADAEEYLFCFLPGGKYTDGSRFYVCCYCDHETALSVSNMKGHINRRCPGVPDDVRQTIRSSIKRPSRRERRRKKKSSDEEESNESSEDSSLGSEMADEKIVEILEGLIPDEKPAKRPRAGDEGVDGKLKEEQLNKLRTEVEQMEGNMNLIRSRINEQKEKINYYQNVNQLFGRIINAADAVLKPKIN